MREEEAAARRTLNQKEQRELESQIKQESEKLEKSRLMLVGLVAEAGVNPPVQIANGEVVPVVRPSKQGGWILFMLNMEHNPIRAQVRTNWLLTEAEDLFARTSISLSDDNSRFEIDIDAWEIAVIHCKT